MTVYKITKLYMELFSAFPSMTSKLRTFVIFKSFVKEKNIRIKLVGMIMKFYCNKLFLRAVVCESSPLTNYAL
jgi:hypothetical protein